ncbi:MAG: putative baseplate assembly protein [bacterium]
MSLPSPNLDDRTFNDIVEEAKKMIPRYCPQWTDFNVSDPGITLIELMAWMTEIILYRLNRVPEKNYIKFLELIGIRLRPPQPAKAWVVFNVMSGVKEEDLSSLDPGTRVSTGEQHGEAIIFETLDALHLTTNSIIKLISRYGEEYEDHTNDLNKETEIPIFLCEKSVPHILYLGDSQFGNIDRNTLLKIFINLQTELPSSLNIEWECWDGKEWNIILPSEDSTFGLKKSGEVVFESLPAMGKKEIHGIISFWIRARLLRGQILPELTSVQKGFESKPGYGLTPGRGFLGLKEPFYQPVDFSREFYPFGVDPAEINAFNIGSRSFSKKNSQIILNIKLSGRYTPSSFEEMKDLEVQWEYYCEKGTWDLLGISNPTGVIKSEHGFEDTTEAFTHNGIIKFICPDDISLFSVQGEENFWIRCRISKGNYGIQDINPPIIKELLISFIEEPHNFDHYLSYNYLSYKDLKHVVTEQKAIEPYEFVPEEDPSLYIAFKDSFSIKLHRLYFRFTQDGEVNNISNLDKFHRLNSRFAQNGVGKNISKITWEYLTKGKWKELSIQKDSTNAFTQTGSIDFIPPSEWGKDEQFDESGYWLRARWTAGTFDKPPKLIGLHLNAVEVIQRCSMKDEILGSGNGEENQTFHFANPSILPDPLIVVREVDNPSSEDIKKLKEDLKEDLIEEKDPETNKTTALWVRWHEVEDFYESGAKDRHYTLDCHKAIISFGNGVKGMIPPIGADNIKCDLYHVGGGSIGNVGKNTICVLERSYPGIESVSNPEKAGGGADADTIEDAKLKGPRTIKHRYRAVTIEDFEALALEASKEVEKASCFSEDGRIKIIILPKEDTERGVEALKKTRSYNNPDYNPKLLPGSMLIRTVKDYLDSRRLINTRLEVKGPDYTDFSVEAEVVVIPQKIEDVNNIKDQIKRQLIIFFHPLKGGPQGEGWQMGRAVHISEIFYLLEQVEGVDYVKDVKLNNNTWEKKVSIGKMSYPHLREIVIKISGE